MKFLKYTLVLLTIISCSTKKKPEDTNFEILSFNSPKKDYQWSEFVEDVTYIKLEPTNESLIGNIDKIRYYNHNYYILDRNISKGLFVFNEKGKFLKEIGKIGRGPEEIFSVGDFAINEATGQVYIYDNKAFKVYTYNAQGFQENSFTIDFVGKNIEYTDEKLYFFCNYVTSDPKIGPYNLIVMDLRGNILSKHLPFDNQIKNHFINKNALYCLDGSISCLPSGSSRLFRIKGSVINTAFKFEFEGPPLTEEHLKLEPEILVSQIMNYSRFLDFNVESQGFFYALFYDNDKTIDLLYLKEKRKLILGRIENDIELTWVRPLAFQDNYQLIGYMDPMDLLDTSERILEAPHNYSAKQKQDFFDKFKDVSLNDNPTIVIYQLKKE